MIDQVMTIQPPIINSNNNKQQPTMTPGILLCESESVAGGTARYSKRLVRVSAQFIAEVMSAARAAHHPFIFRVLLVGRTAGNTTTATTTTNTNNKGHHASCTAMIFCVPVQRISIINNSYRYVLHSRHNNLQVQWYKPGRKYVGYLAGTIPK